MQTQATIVTPVQTPVTLGLVGPLSANEQVVAFPLSEDSSVRVIFSGRVTQDDIEHLIEILKLNKRAYPRAESLQADDGLA